MPALLLLVLSVALSIGVAIVVLVFRRKRIKPLPPQVQTESCPFERTCLLRRPGCWLAIKSRNVLAVQSALGLHHARPCSWVEGLMGDEKLFIAPPVKGWILVMGAGLPDPSEDVDRCYRFLVELSRKLGQVQFFSANRALHHHAWVKADGGRIIRAYAWAGKTLWQQGSRTAAERALELRCFDYTEPAERVSFSSPDLVSLNVEKVPMLAAHWSLDPNRIDERVLETERGVTGELSRRY